MLGGCGGWWGVGFFCFLPVLDRTDLANYRIPCNLGPKRIVGRSEGIHVKHRPKLDRFFILALMASCGASGTLLAQTSDEPPPSHVVDFGFDSGSVSYVGNGEGPQVLYSAEVRADGATWLRLRFGTLVLAGDPARDDRTILRITSLLDGATQ